MPPRAAIDFGPEDADLLAAFAGHAAIALDHARRYENEVHLGRVLAETNGELSRSLVVQQRLAEQVLLDRGPAGIAEVLAEHLGRRVVIQDHIRRVIAGASPSGADDWRALVEGSPEPEPFSVAIRVGREVAGHLVLSAEQDLAPIDRALVDVAVTGVALEFAKIRATLEVEERLRGEAIADLLGGTYPDEPAMAARAARLGHDLGSPHELMLVDVAVPTASSGASDEDETRAGGPDPDRRFVAIIRDVLAKRAPRSLTVLHAGSIVVLASNRGRGDRDGRAIANDILGALENVAGPGTVTIALGDTCRRPADYAEAFAGARRALDLMLKLGRRGGVLGLASSAPTGCCSRHRNATSSRRSRGARWNRSSSTTAATARICSVRSASISRRIGSSDVRRPAASSMSTPWSTGSIASSSCWAAHSTSRRRSSTSRSRCGSSTCSMAPPGNLGSPRRPEACLAAIARHQPAVNVRSRTPDVGDTRTRTPIRTPS